MALGTRATWIDYANLLALDRSSTNSAITSTEKISLVNEIYDWLYSAMTPRVSYLSHAGFSHPDGTTVAADSGLKLVNASDYLMTTNLQTIAEFFSVHFEGIVNGTDPLTMESVPQLEYVEHSEMLQLRAQLSTGIAPRYVHWRRLATTAASSTTAVGKWELMVAPAKLQSAATGHWYFSAVVRKELATPSSDITSSPPLSADGTVPDLLPHEIYLGARLAAYEVALRSGRDPKWCKRIVRNVPEYVRRSYLAARGLGEITVPAK